MKIQKEREIILEFERVRIIQKKARTHLIFCRQCGCEVDFVALGKAASLFDIEAENLRHFIRVSASHFETGADGTIFICLVSLLGALQAKTDISRVRLPGE